MRYFDLSFPKVSLLKSFRFVMVDIEYVSYVPRVYKTHCNFKIIVSVSL